MAICAILLAVAATAVNFYMENARHDTLQYAQSVLDREAQNIILRIGETVLNTDQLLAAINRDLGDLSASPGRILSDINHYRDTLFQMPQLAAIEVFFPSRTGKPPLLISSMAEVNPLGDRYRFSRPHLAFGPDFIIHQAYRPSSGADVLIPISRHKLREVGGSGVTSIAYLRADYLTQLFNKHSTFNADTVVLSNQFGEVLASVGRQVPSQDDNGYQRAAAASARYPMDIEIVKSITATLAPWRAQKRLAEVGLAVLFIAAVSLLAFLYRHFRQRHGLMTAVANNQRQFRDLTESSLSAILIHRGEQPLFVNNAWLQMFGVRQSELSAVSIDDFISPRDMERLVYYRQRRAVGDDTIPSHYEYCALRRSGEEFWVECTVRRTNWHGQPATVVTLSDISDRKQAEIDLAQHAAHLDEMVDARTRELQTKSRQLEAALREERLLREQQRDFAAMISHEYRNPLAIISSAAQRLLMAVSRDRLKASLASELANRIAATVTRMDDLISSTLAAQRFDHGAINPEIAPNSLSAVIGEVVATQRELAPHVRFTLDLHKLPELLPLDPALMHQAISNLIGNAVKFSSTQLAPAVNIVAEVTRSEAIVEIIDNGVGIPQDELHRLGEKFFRASSSTGFTGSGLGISLARTIIELHGGTIQFNSGLENSTIVTLSLPLTFIVRRVEGVQPGS